jgi:hypothetical protein
MSTAHPRPWHRDSVFGDGPRIPMCRERRAVWKARIEIQRRAGQVTDGEAYVGQALLKRLGQDGRCDPSHQTLADDSGESVSTVKRALKAFWDCGLVNWVRRLWRNGTRVSQDTNAYVLTLGEPPKFPRVRCEGQFGRETSPVDKSTDHLLVPSTPASERAAANAALVERQRVIEARLLNKRRGSAVLAT